MFNLVPEEVRFFDLFEQQSQHIDHDRADIHAPATRLADVPDDIAAAADRLVVYRLEEPTSACRAPAEVIVRIAGATDRTRRCLRTMDPGFHEHTVEVNRLENVADTPREPGRALRGAGTPIEGIILKMA
jgi:hypothetical protein